MMARYKCVNTTHLWHVQKPKTRFARYRLLEQEGEKCFLMPKGTPYDPGVPHYPICSTSGCLSCAGMQAAYKRLSMYKKHSREYQKRRSEIDAMLDRLVNMALKYADSGDPTNKCNWALRAARRR